MKEYIRRVKQTVEESWLDPQEHEEVAKTEAAERTATGAEDVSMQQEA